jgi:hypothetical protein
MAPDPYCVTYKELLMDLLWEEATLGIADKKETELPLLFNSMSAKPLACASSGVKVLDAAFEVEGFHCACVLTTK